MLAVPRPIWLLDEPTTALDAASQERLDGLMRAHLDGGGIIVAATHGPLGLAECAGTAARAESRLGRPHDSAVTALAALFARDARIAIRIGGGAMIGVLFFLTVVTLVPFAIGPDLALLRRIGPAILWLGALLASLLTLDRLFASDHDDGSLDLILMGRHAAGARGRGKGARPLGDDRPAAGHRLPRSRPVPQPGTRRARRRRR